MNDAPEFLQIMVVADYESFLWAVEPETGEGQPVGIDFDVLDADVPQQLINRFLRWHAAWEKAHLFVFNLSGERPSQEWYQEFHVEGRALARELSAAIGQPVEYRQ